MTGLAARAAWRFRRGADWLGLRDRSRARVRQNLDLLLVAPDIQEALLFLPRTAKGRDPIHLGQLQPLAAVLDWQQQRRLWQELRSKQAQRTLSTEAGC